jgi:osmotically inducible protein OsmC
MAAERTANVVWQGNLVKGNGMLTLNSGATGDLPVTWASRTERSDGKTSPEELIAAAEASCYAMALSHTLNEQGTPPTRLQVTATCTADLSSGGLKITTMDVQVRGQVPGLDQQRFEETARKAEQGCPVSNALRNNVDIRLRAQLEA